MCPEECNWRFFFKSPNMFWWGSKTGAFGGFWVLSGSVLDTITVYLGSYNSVPFRNSTRVRSRRSQTEQRKPRNI